MKHLVRKPEPDGRHFTRGYVLPDGCYRVISATRWNAQHLTDLENFGYEVQDMDEDDPRLPGLYLEDTDTRVTDESAMAKADQKGEYVEAGRDYEDPAKYHGADKKQIKAEPKRKKAARPKPLAAPTNTAAKVEALLGAKNGNRRPG